MLAGEIEAYVRIAVFEMSAGRYVPVRHEAVRRYRNPDTGATLDGISDEEYFDALGSLRKKRALEFDGRECRLPPTVCRSVALGSR